MVLKRKLVVNGVSHCGLPLEKLIGFWKVAWDEPFSSDVCVKLDGVGIPVVGGNLNGEVRKWDRLVYQVRRLGIRV